MLTLVVGKGFMHGVCYLTHLNRQITYLEVPNLIEINFLMLLNLFGS